MHLRAGYRGGQQAAVAVTSYPLFDEALELNDSFCLWVDHWMEEHKLRQIFFLRSKVSDSEVYLFGFDCPLVSVSDVVYTNQHIHVNTCNSKFNITRLVIPGT